MKDLQADIIIQAPPASVWQVLTDFASFPAWNPFLREAKGDISPGATLAVCIRPPGTRAMRFQATVLNVEANRELVWLGRFWGIRGLLEGEQHFAIENLSTDAVRLTQRATFTGLLTALPPLSGILAQRLQRGMTAMNQALKDRVEHAA
jgi:hypothetical protein